MHGGHSPFFLLLQTAVYHIRAQNTSALSFFVRGTVRMHIRGAKAAARVCEKRRICRFLIFE
jgi:hypothetical protein